MKLYATTTSERATKGQGGNNQLEILLQVDSKLKVQAGRIIMKTEEDGYTIIYYPICGASFRATSGKNMVILLDTTKGKKQKTAKCLRCNDNGCPNCDGTAKSKYIKD